MEAKDSSIMNYVVRMVVPMRREFGRQLDVAQFLRDASYARDVLDEALKSQDQRLLDYARYVNGRLHGARIATPAPSTISPPTSPGAILPAKAAAALTAEDELRAKVMRKYTTGLR